MKKRKLKLKKKKSFYMVGILIIIILLIWFVISKICSKDNDKKVTKNTNSKYNIIENANKKIDFYNDKYYKRYVKYKDSNPKLPIEDIITMVNIGLDNKFYTNTKKTPYLNKPYILVNKYLYVDSDYEPLNLVNVDTKYARSGMRLVDYANEAYIKMCEAAKDDGYTIMATSSYRDYNYQIKLYDNYVKSDGKDAADTYSARPGYSEHQTGLAVDLYDGNSLYTEFESTKSFNWMSENAYKYGFILRFPKDKENITGYQYESWHYRYVGKEIAKYIYKNNLTFEEYYVKKIENKY